MITVSDYVFKYLADYGVKHVFTIVGGGSMFLNEGLRKETRIKYICNHHEQASAICAEGYSRSNKYKLSVVCVTSGPGGLNTLTGVMGQWTDSIPVLYLSGQVKYKTTTSLDKENCLRQLGDQQIDIITIVKPITKYAKMITEPYSIKEELDKAIYLATSGRYGPVWLDIPLDVQNTLIDENKLKFSYKNPISKKYISRNEFKKLALIIEKAKRPLIVAGHGIRIKNAIYELNSYFSKTNIPVVTTFNGFDLFSSSYNNYIGRIGTIGTRAGNFALQNADVILFLGTRNNIRQIGYNWENFAKNAKKIIVDVDQFELYKETIHGDILFNCSVEKFLERLLYFTSDIIYNNRTDWLNWCKEKKVKYSVVLNEYKTNKKINPYYFIERLTDQLKDDSIVVASNGTACVSLFQAGIIKKNSRMFFNSGCASMGYGLPASIGACIANNKEVICIEGDGSLQMNLQELQTVKHYDLPIKIFVLNNQGYKSIIQTQNNFFNGNLIGCNESSGISFPSLKKLSDIYDLQYFKLEQNIDLKKQIQEVLSCTNKLLCEVILDDYIFQPKLSSQNINGKLVSQPLENMFPFLSEEELRENKYEK